MEGADGNEVVDRKLDETVGRGVYRGHFLSTYKEWREMMERRLWVENPMRIFVVLYVVAIF